MEEIIHQINIYHRLSIWCFAGMILCGLITWLIYKKKNMKEVFTYYRRKRKRRKLWMIVCMWFLWSCVPGMYTYAAEAPETPENPENFVPILERFQIGTEDMPVEYVKEALQISVCIRDEQNEFDAEKVLLEYRIADTEIWNPILSQEQLWNNPEESLFENTYEFTGAEAAETMYEFRITYVDKAENAMELGGNVQAEAVEEFKGTYLARKQVVIDHLPPSYEVSYQNENEEDILSSEDGMELRPYYNAAREVGLNFEIAESYLDMEKTKISITAADLKGNILYEKFPELTEGKFQTLLKDDGHYLVKAHLVDLAGNETIHEKKFALDYTPPKQPVITYKTESDSLLERIRNQLTFGYFSKEKTTAYIQAEDEISGLKQVTYSYQETDAEEVVTKTLENAEMPIKVELPYSFKGHLSVQSEDMVGNLSETLKHIGVIAESEQTHKKESKANIQILTQYSKTPDYYAGDVKLKYAVQDSYSGIQKIQYLAGSFGEEEVSYLEEQEIVTDVLTKEYTLSAKDNQENEIAVGLSFTDNAGHTTTVAEEDLPKIHIDTMEPQIRIVYDNYEAENEKYYKRERTATVYVTEKNFDPEDVSFYISGPNTEVGSWRHDAAADCQADNHPYHTGHSTNCVWKCDVKFEADGEYQFGFSCVDLAGNEGDYGKIDEFVIDQTLPKIEVAYNNHDVKNEIYYNTPRIATITIQEKNFHPEKVDVMISAENEGEPLPLPTVSSWSSDGDTHRAAIAYDYDAGFTFDIECVDLAGNEGEDYPGDFFCVDLTKPEVVITDIADKSANHGMVSPVITVTDTNYGKGNTWFEVVGWENGLVEVPQATVEIPKGEMIRIKDFEHVKEADDLYRLTVGATDLAGNITETRISFSVNRFGSVYTLDEETEKLAGKGGIYYTNVEKHLVVTETNVDTLEFLEIVCSLNGKLRTLTEGKDYFVHKSGEEFGWKQYRYEIFKDNFVEDGHYTVTIYSEDRARNVSDNQSKGKSLSFAVDKTSPSIVISGIEQKGRYRENSREILLDVQDNLAIAGLTVHLDGETAVYDQEALNTLRGKVSVTARGKNEWQTLKVSAEDRAGNQIEIENVTFLITPNLWVQFYNHKPLFYGSIITILLSVLLYFFLHKFLRISLFNSSHS